MAAANQPKFIGRDEVWKLLKPKELLENIEIALGKFSQGRDGGIEQPSRAVINVEKYKGHLAVMPGYSESDNALATKLVSFYPHNSDRPTHQAWVMLFDPLSGSLLAMIDGESITALRTGIVSAVATKHLASPNSKILAILGSGVQARSHYNALKLIQDFEEVRVWSRTHANAEAFAKEIGAKVCETPEEAVRDADVICTVTFATRPIIMKSWVKPGAHINAVGACRPEWQEIDCNLMKSAVVYCDSKEECLRDSGDIVLSEAGGHGMGSPQWQLTTVHNAFWLLSQLPSFDKCDIFAEIGDVINGRKQALWEKTTIFKSVGMAIEDVISAKLVYDKYVKDKDDDNLFMC